MMRHLSVEGKVPLKARPSQGERGVGLLLVLIIIGLLSATTAGGVTAYIVLREEVSPLEQTAKFLPEDTQIYFSLNLRPGNDQLRKFRDILERFRQHPSFQSNIDDLFEDAKGEIGIDIQEEVLPWLGPEVAVGLIDVVDAAVAAGSGGAPQLVVFIGTTDNERSKVVLEQLIDFIEQEEDQEIAREAYKGLPIYVEPDAQAYVGLTEEYILVTTARNLLENAIDRIMDGDSARSLYESDRFQEARDAAPGSRFSMLYVNADSIREDVNRLLREQIPPDIRSQLNELVPKWATITSSLIDKGLKLVLSAPTGEDALRASSRESSLAATKYLPRDTPVFLAFALKPDLEPLREQLREVKPGDLSPEVTESITAQLGLPIQPGDDLFDAALDRFQSTTGLNLEGDVLDWMTGEFAFALLSTDFFAISNDPTIEAIRATAFIHFEKQKRDKVTGLMNTVLELLQETFQLQPTNISFGGGVGATFPLTDFIGITPYQPGYLILDDHLIIATTPDDLELAASIGEGKADSLADEPEYSRLLKKEVSGSRQALLYVNLQELRNAIIAAFDSDTRREYQEEAESFVEPFRALMLSGDTKGDISRALLIVTIE